MTDKEPIIDDVIDRAVERIAESDRLVVFTGAGVSTESGIPDFRSPGGIWDRYDPKDFTIQSLKRDPVSYWEKRLEMESESDIDWENVEPNPAHEAIARLEHEGLLSCVITQNVDGLHQAAGNDPADVLELHGTREGAKCLDCDRRPPVETIESKLKDEPLPPRCDACGGLLKYATVSFGEKLPPEVLSRARRESRECDCFLVVGSSVAVEPAASLPRVAARNDASLLVVNLDSTGVDRSADVVINGKAGETVPLIVDRAIT